MDKDLEFASNRQRILAGVIDLGLWTLCFGNVFLVTFLVSVFITIYITYTSGNEVGFWLENDLSSWPSLFNLTSPLAYFVLVAGQVIFLVLQGYPLAAQGQTIGKKRLGIAIVHEATGEKLRFGRHYIKRNLLFESLIVVSYFLYVIVRLVDFGLLFTKIRRTLHDCIAKTIIVKVAIEEPRTVSAHNRARTSLSK